jgi:hypothetical protein
MRDPTDFIFKTKPFEHQLTFFERFRDAEYAAAFTEPGTGKSWMMINTAAWLYSSGKITGLLVVVNKSITRNWVDLEVPAHLPDYILRVSACYDAQGKKETRDAVEKVLTDRSGALRILAVNVESLSISKEGKKSKGYEVCERFLLGNNALFVCDESTSIKHESALRTKACVKLSRLANYRRIATGDPYANSPLDIYAQCEFLSPEALGFGSFFTFKNHFAEILPLKVFNARTKKTKTAYTIRTDKDGRKMFKNIEELKRIVGRFSFTVKKEDCLDLPPKVHLAPRRAEMTPRQARVYEEMRKTGLAEIEKKQREMFGDEAAMRGRSVMDLGPSAPDNTALAGIVLTRLLRLQQIACGFVTNEEGKEVDLTDGSNGRVQAVLDAVAETSEKVIIWAPFRRSIDELIAALTKEYGVESVVRCDGSTTSDELEEAKRRFQDPNDSCRFFVGSQAKGGRGLTLTAAGLMIFFANSFDGELRVQAEDRCHRIGLTHSVAYQDVRSAPIDDRVAAALDAKKTISDLLRSGDWRRLFEE